MTPNAIKSLVDQFGPPTIDDLRRRKAIVEAELDKLDEIIAAMEKKE